MTSPKPTQGAGRMRAGAGIGRTVLALAVVLVIFIVLAVFLLLNPSGDGGGELLDNEVIGADVAAAREAYPQVAGTAPEHLLRAQQYAVEPGARPAAFAYEEYRKALSLDPGNVEALLGIAALYPRLGAAGVDFPVERALEYCEAVAEVYPDDPAPHRVKAELSMALRGWAGGVEAWNRVLALYPDDHEARRELGRCLMELGRHDAATVELERVAAAQPDAGEALLVLAENHRRAKQFASAFGALARMDAIGTAAADAAVVKARVFEEVGDELHAREQVRIALRHDGNHPQALLRNAIYRYQDDGDLGDAREDLLRILSRTDIDERPELRDATALQMGIVLRLSGNHAGAHRYLDPLVLRDAGNVAARFHWAKVRLAEGTIDDVVGPYGAMLLDRDPEAPEPWFLAGQLHARSDNLPEVVAGFEAALDRDPLFRPSYFALIHIIAGHDNPDDIRALVSVLYREEAYRPVLIAPERIYRGVFDLAEVAPSIPRAARQLEQDRPAGNEHLQLRALYHYVRGEYGSAAALFQQLSRKTEGDVTHELMRGRAALAQGDRDAAAAAFRRAADDTPTDAMAQYLAGRMLEEQGRSESAEQRFSSVVANHREDPRGYHGMARLAHRAGDVDEARTQYGEALEVDPSFLPALRDRLLLDLEMPLIAGVL